jgi:argininosuccinate lyase
MPQKKNPDILELTRGKTAQIIGYLMAILSNIKGLPSGYGRDLQQIKTLIWPSSKIAISALIVNNAMLKTIRVNKHKMKKAIDSGYSISIDIAELLVKKGIPFRTAHMIVGQLVQTASNLKKPLSSLSQYEIKKSFTKHKMNPKELHEIIQSMNAYSSLEQRISQGSSGRSEQERMILDRKKRIQAYRIGTTKRANGIKTTFENLTVKIRTITK